MTQPTARKPAADQGIDAPFRGVPETTGGVS